MHRENNVIIEETKIEEKWNKKKKEQKQRRKKYRKRIKKNFLVIHWVDNATTKD